MTMRSTIKSGDPDAFVADVMGSARSYTLAPSTLAFEVQLRQMNDQGGPQMLAAACALVKQFSIVDIHLSRKNFSVTVPWPEEKRGDRAAIHDFISKVNAVAMAAASRAAAR